jgi:DNA-binding response OmpR family regulator
MRLLLVEDDTSVGEAARTGLMRHGMVCDWVLSAAEFNAAMVNHTYDCILLDLTLPDGNGSNLLEAVRRRGDTTPVIVLTAQWQGESSVNLLDSGADDYVVKPYDVRNLMARVRAVMRRARTTETSNSLVHGPLVLHVDGRVATWYGELVPLTKKEYWLLEAMLRQRNRMLSRAQLEDALYGWGEETESNTIEVYIHHLRRKFNSKLIVTVRGLGYQICAETAFSDAAASKPEASPV